MKFKFYSNDVVQKVRKLKKKGISAAEISRRLNIGDSTISRWCDDIPSNNSYHRYVQKLKDNAKKRSSGLLKKIKINRETAKLIISLLYWCEGSKYPSSNFISFSNSEADLVKTFMILFRIGFQPKESKIKVHLQLHTIHNREKMTSFWSEILKIPKSQFYKPTITKPTKNMKRRNYRGTCTVRYYDVFLLHEITGVYKEFFKKLK